MTINIQRWYLIAGEWMSLAMRDQMPGGEVMESRRCDCWICRYSKNPCPLDNCPHPHYPHNGTPEQEAAKAEYRSGVPGVLPLTELRSVARTLKAERDAARDAILKYCRTQCTHPNAPGDCGLCALDHFLDSEVRY
jgi:hypothetical protein